jgi:hypothetical protein
MTNINIYNDHYCCWECNNFKYSLHRDINLINAFLNVDRFVDLSTALCVEIYFQTKLGAKILQYMANGYFVDTDRNTETNVREVLTVLIVAAWAPSLATSSAAQILLDFGKR